MATMQAFVTDGNGSAAVKPIPRPSPGPGEVLVKIHYAAQNPTDYKAVTGHAGGPPPPGLIAGCDFAGTISDPGTSSWEVGQRVAGFVQGTSRNGTGTNPARGAFAEYIPVEESLVFAVPDGVELRDAATVPLTFATAVQALYQRLALPEPGSPAEDAPPLLVYGGGGSVGRYAIQLGKLSGFRVIATASPGSHDELKGLGADEVFDYHDEAWPERVYETTGGRLRHAFDTVGSPDSPVKVARSLSREGGDLCVLRPLGQDLKDEVVAANPKVRAQSTAVYTVFERPLAFFAMVGFDNCGEETPEDKAVWEKYLKLLTGLLREGSVRPNKVREVGTLHDVLTGFKLLQEGKISGEKVVYKVVG